MRLHRRLEREGLLDGEAESAFGEQPRCFRHGAYGIRRGGRNLCAVLRGAEVGDRQYLVGLASELDQLEDDAGASDIEGRVDPVRGKVTHSIDEAGAIGRRDSAKRPQIVLVAFAGGSDHVDPTLARDLDDSRTNTPGRPAYQQCLARLGERPPPHVSGPNFPVDPVHASRPNGDPYLTRTRVRLIDLDNPQYIGTTVLSKLHRPHQLLLASIEFAPRAYQEHVGSP